jgi:pimeloyl-ACP methyl ester carboxylesterase
MLWHSMFVDSTSWDRVLPRLSERRRLFLVDAPSSGHSDPLRRPADIAACGEVAGDVLSALSGQVGGPVDWLGNAWGGHVGMHLAATHPELVRSLIAISAPTHPINLRLRAKIYGLLPLYRLFGPRGLPLKAIEETLFTDETRSNDPDAIALLRASMRRTTNGAMVQAIRTAILNRTELNWAAAAITCPVLFVTTDDRGEWTPQQARSVAATMPDAREVTISEARVIPSIEQPEALALAVEDFWAQTEKNVGTS